MKMCQNDTAYGSQLNTVKKTCLKLHNRNEEKLNKTEHWMEIKQFFGMLDMQDFYQNAAI